MYGSSQKGIGGLVAREDCILVIIDVQDKLMPVIADKEKVISNVARLVQFCRITGIPLLSLSRRSLEAPSLKSGVNCPWKGPFRRSISTVSLVRILLSG